MTTLSIPVDDDMARQIKALIAQGAAKNITDIGRTAIKKYLEDLAVQQVLHAQKEPSLNGDLDDLAKQL